MNSFLLRLIDLHTCSIFSVYTGQNEILCLQIPSIIYKRHQLFSEILGLCNPNSTFALILDEFYRKGEA
jgi:hypothetical protein